MRRLGEENTGFRNDFGPLMALTMKQRFLNQTLL